MKAHLEEAWSPQDVAPCTITMDFGAWLAV